MKSEILQRKEKIIITAIMLLYEAGINGMTIKEIAKRQNISEPAIYRHFNGKREIVKEIFKRYSIYDEAIKNTIIENNMDAKQSIKYFCGVYAEYYQNYPEITTVMFSLDIFRYDEQSNEEMKKIIKKRYNLLLEFISKATETRKKLSENDVQAIADTIFSTLWGTTFLWRMENCSFDLKERILLAVDNIVDF